MTKCGRDELGGGAGRSQETEAGDTWLLTQLTVSSCLQMNLVFLMASLVTAVKFKTRGMKRPL